MRPIPTEEARLLEAAWNAQQAVNSPEHQADVDLRAKLSGELQAVHDRVNARLYAYSDSMNALRDYHTRVTEDEGREPHPNAEARAVINGDDELFDEDLDDYAQSYGAEPELEFNTARNSGAQ